MRAQGGKAADALNGTSHCRCARRSPCHATPSPLSERNPAHAARLSHFTSVSEPPLLATHTLSLLSRWQEQGRQAVVRVLGVHPADYTQIRAGGLASKRAEVAMEVGFIVIACLLSDPRPGAERRGVRVRVEACIKAPIDGPIEARVKAIKDVLQAVEARQLLGRGADQPLELGDEVFVADTQLLAERIDREVLPVPRGLGHRLPHRRIPGIAPWIAALPQILEARQPRQQQALEQGQARLRCGLSSQSLADLSGGPPDGIE